MQLKDNVYARGNRNGDPVLRRRRRLHRYLGLSAAFFLVLLVLTGILLQHQQDLDLDQRFVTARPILDLYHIKAPDSYQACETPHLQLTRMGEALFRRTANGPFVRLNQNVANLIGCVELADRIFIATDKEVLLYSLQGEFIDSLSLPFEPTAIGQPSSLRPIIVLSSNTGLFSTDESALAVTPLSDTQPFLWSQETHLTTAELEGLQSRYLGDVLSWQRILRDLHSGQILGSWGKWLVDLVALGILILACSGIALWWRGRGR